MSVKGYINVRQERFCQGLAAGLGPEVSALNAGYSERVIAEQAKSMARKPKIKQRVQEILDGEAGRLGISSTNILQEFSRIAFLNPANVINISDLANHGIVRLHNPALLSDDDIRAICEVQQTKRGLKIKFYNKLEALNTLARCRGLLDQVEVEPPRDTRFTVEIVGKDGTMLDTKGTTVSQKLDESEIIH